MKSEQNTGTPRHRQPSRTFSAKQKAQAVLALWSGRRSASALTKELDVPWAIINTWEKRALSGMLTALDPLWKQTEEGPLRLPARLEKLMEQTLTPAPVNPPAATT